MATAQRAEKTLSTTEYSVLGLLLARGERSGYDLKKAADEGVGYVWTAAKSHIYAVLPRLVEGGYATTRRVAQERLPDKQVYRITNRGERAFREWLEQPVELVRPRDPLLLKLFFGGRMSKEALVGHVERRRREFVDLLVEYREVADEIRDDDSSYFGYVTLRWGLARVEASIRWADEILAELEERP